MKKISVKINLVLLLCVQAILIFGAHEKLSEKDPFELFCSLSVVRSVKNSQVLIKYAKDSYARLHESYPQIESPRSFADFCKNNGGEVLNPTYDQVFYYFKTVLKPWAIEAREIQLPLRKLVWKPSHIAILGMLRENNILPETVNRTIVEYARELTLRDYGIEYDRIINVLDGELITHKISISPDKSFGWVTKVVAQQAKIPVDTVLLVSVWRGCERVADMKRLVYEGLFYSQGYLSLLRKNGLSEKNRKKERRQVREGKSNSKRCLIS